MAAAAAATDKFGGRRIAGRELMDDTQDMTALDARTSSAARKPPLAVDLDGTLFRGDVFIEAILRFIFSGPFNILVFAGWMTRGIAYAKARVAEAAPFEAQHLPYDARVIAWIKDEREGGREVVLATACDQSAAQAVAEHLGLFDAVFASDGKTNLKARKKADRLAEAYPDGFVYAGNDTPDLSVWARAHGAVVVNAPSSLEKQVQRKHEVEQIFPRQGGGLRALIKAIRPQQWAKNALVFLPLIAGQGWSNPAAWGQAWLAFFAISFAASSLYLVNDASDIDADRVHARKRKRPFASGALSPVIGLATSIVLFSAAIALGAVAGVVPFVALYLATSALYTFWFKRLTLIDVFVLGALYTIRVVLGGVATGYFVSSWLLAFCCFFFLSLALVKRAVEVDTVAKRGGEKIKRRGYQASDGPMLKMMGVGASFAAALVLALYTQSPEIVAHYRFPQMLWALPAAVIFWLCRVWLIADRGDIHDDPLVFAFSDRMSWLIGALLAAAFAGAVLLPGL